MAKENRNTHMSARLEVMVTLDDFLICLSKCLPAKKGEGLKNTRKAFFKYFLMMAKKKVNLEPKAFYKTFVK